MKYFILSLALVFLLANRLQGGVVLGTSNPSDTPLTMNSESISGPMFVTVYSDDSPNDVMAAWNVQLEINTLSGATGTLTFQDPGTAFPSNPPNYIFGGSGFAISATNSGSTLSANDFYFDIIDPTAGMPVPAAPVANLLQMDFLASSNASGLFGVYAVRGSPITQWTDTSATTQFFTNVPDGTGTVLIGEVMVNSAGVQPVPEPSSLTLFWLGGTILAGRKWWRKRKQRETTILEAYQEIVE